MGHDRVRAILCAKELSGEDMEKHLGLNFLIYGYRGVEGVPRTRPRALCVAVGAGLDFDFEVPRCLPYISGASLRTHSVMHRDGETR